MGLFPPLFSVGTICLQWVTLWGWRSMGTEVAGTPGHSESVLAWLQNARGNFGYTHSRGGIVPTPPGCWCRRFAGNAQFFFICPFHLAICLKMVTRWQAQGDAKIFPEASPVSRHELDIPATHYVFWDNKIPKHMIEN